MTDTYAEGFHSKSRFYSNFKQFWVVQNSFPIVEKLTNINHKKNTKTISTSNFRTLYTTIPLNLLINVLNEISSFVFNYHKIARAGFSKSFI